MTTRFRHLNRRLVRWLARDQPFPEPRSQAPRQRRARPRSIVRVDDPDGRLRILAVRGVVPATVINELTAHVSDLTSGDQVHVELTDAIIVGVNTMAGLGVLADRLEARGVDVRIVGVDPDHPAIPRTR